MQYLRSIGIVTIRLLYLHLRSQPVKMKHRTKMNFELRDFLNFTVLVLFSLLKSSHGRHVHPLSRCSYMSTEVSQNYKASRQHPLQDPTQRFQEGWVFCTAVRRRQSEGWLRGSAVTCLSVKRSTALFNDQLCRCFIFSKAVHVWEERSSRLIAAWCSHHLSSSRDGDGGWTLTVSEM